MSWKAAGSCSPAAAKFYWMTKGCNARILARAPGDSVDSPRALFFFDLARFFAKTGTHFFASRALLGREIRAPCGGPLARRSPPHEQAGRVVVKRIGRA